MLKPVSPTNSSSGLTLVELLVTLTVVSVLAGAVIPGITNFIIEKELGDAQSQIALAITSAKNFAKTQSTSVTISTDKTGSTLSYNNRLILDFGNNTADRNIDFADIKLETTGGKNYVFSSMGTVDNFGNDEIITITSAKDDTKTKTINIATKLGQIILD